jgi:hypothetical protein
LTVTVNTTPGAAPKRSPIQIEHFLIPCTQLCHTLNVQRKFDGVDSDHAALLMNFELDCYALLSHTSNKKKEKTAKKEKNDNHILCTDGKSNFQKGSPITLTALTLPPHKNSQCKNSSKTLKSTLLNLPLK